jgi:hypothetical protein
VDQLGFLQEVTEDISDLLTGIRIYPVKVEKGGYSKHDWRIKVSQAGDCSVAKGVVLWAV